MLPIKLFAGNSVPLLAQSIAEQLQLNLSKVHISRFSDGEISVEIQDTVHEQNIFIIQSTCWPANDHLMELVLMIDALRRASAKQITAVIPYFGYARQDRRACSAKVPITARVVANLLTNVGVNRILTLDLHSEQIEGFFDIPVDNLFSGPVLFCDVNLNKLHNPIVVAPDIGGIVRARAIAKQLKNNEIAIIDKQRSQDNTVQVMNVIGDVSGRDCILCDDIIDTGGTLIKAAQALKENNAGHIIAYATHPVLSGNSISHINNSHIDKIIVTDTIPINTSVRALNKVQILTTSAILANAIYSANI